MDKRISRFTPFADASVGMTKGNYSVALASLNRELNIKYNLNKKEDKLFLVLFFSACLSYSSIISSTQTLYLYPLWNFTTIVLDTHLKKSSKRQYTFHFNCKIFAISSFIFFLLINKSYLVSLILIA